MLNTNDDHREGRVCVLACEHVGSEEDLSDFKCMIEERAV